MARIWNKIVLKVPSNLNHSVIIRNLCSYSAQPLTSFVHLCSSLPLPALCVIFIPVIRSASSAMHSGGHVPERLSVWPSSRTWCHWLSHTPHSRSGGPILPREGKNSCDYQIPWQGSHQHVAVPWRPPRCWGEPHMAQTHPRAPVPCPLPHGQLLLYHSWNKTFFCVCGEMKKQFSPWEPQSVMYVFLFSAPNIFRGLEKTHIIQGI